MDLKPDIIMLCESWCNANTNIAGLGINGYELLTDLRKDRKDTANGIGGGLIVYARDGLVILPCDQVIEFNQYCKFKISDRGDSYYIYLVYRPPAAGRASKDRLCELLRTAEKNSIFVGDFNLPGVDWSTGEANGEDDIVMQEVQENNFSQMVDFKTHIKGGCLDLVITNMPEKVSNVSEAGRLGKSDHVIIQFDLEISSRGGGEKKLVKNWRRADWEKIRRGLEATVWPTTEDRATAEEAWQQMRDVIDGLVKDNVPEVAYKQKKTDWMTSDVLRELRKKRRLWKKAKNGGSMEEYELAAKKVKNLIRSAKRSMEKKLANKKDGNKKPFYNYVKRKTKSRAGIGPITKDNGELATEDREVAEELNRYFSSVFTREDTTNVPAPPPMVTRTRLTRSFITTEKVRRKIRQLKAHSAAGPDGISPKFLQQCSDQLAPVLAMIFRKSVNNGQVPEEWRTATVVPIYKKGAKSAAGNYRPVSLTCVSCKVLESILKDDIMEHLSRNKLIKSSQHGFVKGKSCTTNLLEFLDKITEAADRGIATDVVYLDFAKAFDKVPTERLLKKLEAHGIGGKVGSWIRAWLADRKQRVCVNGKQSGWRKVLSGVPQGSVLGPVLFLIFINDLDQEATVRQIVKKFADDTKIAQCIEKPEDAAELQESLDRMSAWAVKWGMEFNVAKCHVMHIGRNNPEHVYLMGGTQLGKTAEERDVGVTITSNLKPRQQCRKAAQTASAVLGQITRAFHYRDSKVFLGLYKQYVRPHLEFAVAAWSPWTQEDLETLEKVQKRAVKAVSGLRSQSYEDRLAELKLPSLRERRKEIDMVQTYKLVNDAGSEQFFRRADERRVTRATTGTDNLVKGRSNHEFRANFFSSRVIEDWNNLPNAVKEATSAERFKRQYRRHQVGTVAPAREG